MELLGQSLESLFQANNRKLSLKTVCMCALQMIDRLEWVHSRNLIHRDIKPDNFVIGKNKKSHILYLIDFGLSKKYWSNSTKSHIKFTMNKKMTGTARYVSINGISGGEQSRRDDLESLCYVLIYLLKGELPWQGLKIERKEERYKKIYEKKKNTTEEKLCEGLPEEFQTYLKYIKNIKFDAKPDYNHLRKLFYSILEKNELKFDYIYDWTESKEEIDDDPYKYFYDDKGVLKSNLHSKGWKELNNKNNELGYEDLKADNRISENQNNKSKRGCYII